MPISETYQRQVALLLRVLPFIAQEDCFALKGGTAINLFIRDMPRLSVDIDLTYLPIRSWNESVAEIDAAMKRIEQRILAGLAGSKINRVKIDPLRTFHVSANHAQIKVEVTPVLRGTVFEPELRSVSPAVEEQFGFAELPVVSFADLYAGKLVAALDRQHPRDLFDVRDLLAHEGITDDIREAFIIYMLSHKRPMGEVLLGTRKDTTQEYLTSFEGMTAEPVALQSLNAAFDGMVITLIGGMPDRHKQFLMGFEAGNPEWSLLEIAHASTLPAVTWRQQNLKTLSGERRAELVAMLQKALSTDGTV